MLHPCKTIGRTAVLCVVAFTFLDSKPEDKRWQPAFLEFPYIWDVTVLLCAFLFLPRTEQRTQAILLLFLRIFISTSEKNMTFHYKDQPVFENRTENVQSKCKLQCSLYLSSCTEAACMCFKVWRRCTCIAVRFLDVSGFLTSRMYLVNVRGCFDLFSAL